MTVHVVDHPLIKHKLGIMREDTITVKDFRDLASEIAALLTYEATKDLETEVRAVRGWAGSVTVERIKGKKITVVPILGNVICLMGSYHWQIDVACAVGNGRFRQSRCITCT